MIRQHIYENRTPKPVTVILPSENNLTASEMTFGPFGRIELMYAGLDQYVPHKLTKVHFENGQLLLTSAPVAVEPVVEVTVVVIPEPVVEVVVEPVVVPEVVVEEPVAAEEVIEETTTEEVVEEKTAPVKKTKKSK